jgi:hypothetical protein
VAAYLNPPAVTVADAVAAGGNPSVLLVAPIPLCRLLGDFQSLLNAAPNDILFDAAAAATAG